MYFNQLMLYFLINPRNIDLPMLLLLSCEGNAVSEEGVVVDEIY